MVYLVVYGYLFTHATLTMDYISFCNPGLMERIIPMERRQRQDERSGGSGGIFP
jgi:hypothetical protein